MRRNKWLALAHCRVLLVIATSISFIVPCRGEAGGIIGPPQGTVAGRRAALPSLPLSFEENIGQLSDRVRFLSRTDRYNLFLTSKEAVMSLGAGGGHQLIRMKPLGASRPRAIEGIEELPGKSNYLVSSDRANWHTGIPNFARVRYRGVYPGVDLIYHGERGELEYDWVVHRGADPAKIRLLFSGIKTIRTDETGDLTLETAAGRIRSRKPVAYQEINGARSYIDVSYVRTAKNQLGFKVGQYNPEADLVIDPILVFTAIFSGNFPPPSPPQPGESICVTCLPSPAASATAIALDASGNIYVTAFSGGFDFPTTASLTSTGTSLGFFVLKVNAAGTALLFSTFIGGGAARGISVDSSGNAYITGDAGAGFPTTPDAFLRTFAGFSSAFVAKLSPDGSALVYSTFLGTVSGRGLAVDGLGNAYVVGNAFRDFPVTPGALQTCGNSGGTLITKVNPQGRGLVYSACVGGGFPGEIVIDSAGNAYVAGGANSGFQTAPGSFQPSFSGGNCPTGPCADGFVLKLNPAGSALVYSTFLGGFGIDGANAIAIDATGNAYITGNTSAGDFPTKNPIQASFQGGDSDIFVTKLNPSGSALVYSTYLGGRVNEAGAAIAVDSAGSAYITGHTTSPNFPLANPIQAALSGGSPPTSPCVSSSCGDAFIVKLSPDGSALAYSTYFGGGGNDGGNDIAVDAAGNAYLAGFWGSGPLTFPSVGPLQKAGENSNGGAFIVKISDTGSTPAFSAKSITNAASFQTGLVAGEIASLFGQKITNVTGIVSASSFPLPTQLAGTSVTINGVPVPLFAVANVNGQEQINFQIPRGIGVPPIVVVNNNGSQSVPIAVSNLLGPPGIFTTDGTTGAIQHAADFAAVTPSSPAAKGETVVIYATGLGVVQPEPGVGNPASASPLSVTVNSTSVTVGGVPAQVLFSGLAPGFVGLNQVNIQIPPDAPSGEVDVVITVALPNTSVSSKPVKIFVQ